MTDTFGQKLRKLREDNGLTQPGLRNKLDKWGYVIRSNGTISKWENDVNKPSEEIIETLADILGVPQDNLLREAGYLRDPSEPGRAEADPLTLRSKQDHTDRMVDIAITLLGEKPRKISPEIVWTPDGTLPPTPLEESMSARTLTQALTGARDAILCSGARTNADFAHLEAHLRRENATVGQLGLSGAMKKHPGEVVKALRLLARRKTFKGKCEVCKDL